MMRYGLPAYRMPRDVLGGEIERIAALGVRFTNNHVSWTLTRSAAKVPLTLCSSRSARICQSGWRFPPWMRGRSWMPFPSCAALRRASGR